MPWSPDGLRLAISQGRTVSILDALTYSRLLTLTMPDGVSALTGFWSPDGGQLVTIDSLSNTIHLWDAHAGTLLRTLDPGTQSGIGSSLAWSPDGKRIVSYRGDSLRVWDVIEGAEKLVLEGFVVEAFWSPEGTRLAVLGSSPGPVEIWDLSGFLG